MGRWHPAQVIKATSTRRVCLQPAVQDALLLDSIWGVAGAGVSVEGFDVKKQVRSLSTVRDPLTPLQIASNEGVAPFIPLLSSKLHCWSHTNKRSSDTEYLTMRTM